MLQNSPFLVSVDAEFTKMAVFTCEPFTYTNSSENNENAMEIFLLRAKHA